MIARSYGTEPTFLAGFEQFVKENRPVAHWLRAVDGVHRLSG
jgi:hypothetical protein